MDTTIVVPDNLWTVGDVVRKLRDDRGWSQKQLGEEAGINKGTIVALEANSDKADQRTLYRVAKALEVSVADLYAYADPVSLSAEQRDWLRTLTDLEPTRRALALQVARRELQAQKAETSGRDSAGVADPAKTGTVNGA